MSKVKVFHLNNYVRSFPDYDSASEWKWEQKCPEDYEIVEAREL